MEEKQPKARVLAYYLPQYHPTPENDAWWGKGFTEWIHVGKAKPLFPGHNQPRIPADLGYYDLRLPEIREEQARMAQENGIEGFVYYHYWFGNGKRMLQRPFNDVLTSGKPDFPFALAWANDSWSSTMHGLREGETLLEQTYPGDDDYLEHFNTVLPAFKDQRYITCEGKPIFMIYLPESMPEMKHFIDYWQNLAQLNGLKGIYFIAFSISRITELDTSAFYRKMIELGFDAVVFENMQPPRNTIPFLKRCILKLNRKFLHWPLLFYYNDKYFAPDLCWQKKNAFPTIIPNWDHTPRSGKRGSVMLGSSPEKFQQTMHMMIERLQTKAYENRFLFVKSWNEWGEGNYIEPDTQYGYKWLEAIKKEVYKK